MKILLIEPGHMPRPERISDTIEAIRKIVGSDFQAVYPENDVALVYNKCGTLLHLPPNREIPDSDGDFADIAYGTFFLCGAPEDRNHFTSLTDEQLQKYSERFTMPETFLNLGGRMIAFPCEKSADPKADNTRVLWARLGAVLEITSAEEQAIFSDEDSRMEEALNAIITEGRFHLDGESYVPIEAVTMFNQAFRTLNRTYSRTSGRLR